MTFISDAAVARLREAAAWPAFPTRYAALRVAGRGGSATVYAARDEALDREVAIKVLDVPDRAGQAADRLAREARILARLDHPGIVPIHDAGVLADGRTFYVMKLVNGEPLDVAAAAHTTLADRLALFERVLETVAFAHAQGFVHRDLKPPNVLVGAFGEVFVMDWGAAHADRAPEPGLIAGTPGFMSPEQALGAPVDGRADVFALGAVLRGLAGADAPPALRAVADKAGAPVAQNRYAGVRALAEDLRRFRLGLVPVAYAEPLGARLLRCYRQHELPVLLVFAYVLMRAVVLLWRGI
ncbi:MAG: serine/threonine protein kinase [Acidobacteria bacterium]|nr:serine/threonine protein kinase [Acidobacteriota bacterium]